MDNAFFKKKFDTRLNNITVNIYSSKKSVDNKTPTKIKTVMGEACSFLTYETTLSNFKQFVAKVVHENNFPEFTYITDVSGKPLQTHLSSYTDIAADLQDDSIQKHFGSRLKRNKRTDELIHMDSNLLKTHFAQTGHLEINVYLVSCFFSISPAEHVALMLKKYYLDLVQRVEPALLQQWLLAKINKQQTNEDLDEQIVENFAVENNTFLQYQKYNVQLFKCANEMIVNEEPPPNVYFRSVSFEKQLAVTATLDLEAIFQLFETSSECPLIRLAGDAPHTVVKFKMHAPFYLATNVKYLQTWLKRYNHIPAKCIKISCMHKDNIQYDFTLFHTGIFRINFSKQDLSVARLNIFFKELRTGGLLQRVISLLHQLRQGKREPLRLTIDDFRMVSSEMFFNMPDNGFNAGSLNVLLKTHPYFFSGGGGGGSNDYDFIAIDNYQQIPKLNRLIKDFFDQQEQDIYQDCVNKIEDNRVEITEHIKELQLNFSDANIKSALDVFCGTFKRYYDNSQARGIDLTIVGSNMFKIKNASTMEELHTFLFYLRVALYCSAKTPQNSSSSSIPAAAAADMYYSKIDRLKKINPEGVSSNYSTVAQKSNGAQPIILTKKNLDNIIAYLSQVKLYDLQTQLATYGGIEDDLGLKDKLMSKDVLYEDASGSFYYICPKVWCIRCELPFLLKEQLLQNPLRCPKCSGTEIKSGVGVKSGSVKNATLLIEKDTTGRRWHPDMKKSGYVLCGKKTTNMGRGDSSIIYIMQDRKKHIPFGKFMHLPEALHRILNGTSDKKAATISNDPKFVRKGVLEALDDEHHLSFEKALECLLRNDAPPLDNFRQYLLELLQENQNIKQIFQKCRKGSLALFFDQNIENLYKYIRQATSLNYIIILPLLSFPGVVQPEGLNFFMFSSQDGDGDGDKVSFECEFVSNPSAENLLMYKYVVEDDLSAAAKKKEDGGDGDGGDIRLCYYDPIVQIKKHPKRDAKTTAKKTHIVLTTCESDTIKPLFKLYRKQCAQAETTPPMPSFNNATVYGQFVSSYNQTEGLFVLYKNTRFYYPLPHPVGTFDDLPQTTDKTLIPVQNLDSTLDFLREAAGVKNINLTCDFKLKTTRRLYLPDHDTFVILKNEAIELEEIQLLYEQNKIARDVINERKINKLTAEDTSFAPRNGDKQKIFQANADTQRANYEKIKHMLSSILDLQEMADTKATLEERLKRFAQAKTEFSRKDLRTIVIRILHKILGAGNALTQGPLGPWSASDLHQPCFQSPTKDTCNATSMCIWQDQVCKTIVPDNRQYLLILSKLADELLTNRNLRNDILENRHPTNKQNQQLVFYTKHDLITYIKTHDFADNAALIKAPTPFVHFDYMYLP